MDPRTWGMPFPVVTAVLFVIVMVRANATYWLGRLARRGAGHTRAASLFQRPGYRRAEAAVERWGAIAVALCFLTVGVQTMINFVAGAGRMSMPRYLPAVVLGSVLWALLYASLGFVGFGAIKALWQQSPALAVAVAILLISAIAAYIVVVRRRQHAGDNTGSIK